MTIEVNASVVDESTMLICTQALLQSRDGQDSDAAHREFISRSTCGVVFMETPFRGSGHANYAAVLARIIQHLPGIPSNHLIEELRASAP